MHAKLRTIPHATGRPRRLAQRGISLIEALVAMLVMSFGMLAIVGLQATLRLNADVAKQRAEAVRIAQAEVERWRGFSSLAGGADDESFANLASSAADVVTVGQNATYTLRRTVTDSADGSVKAMVVDVTWLDRLDAPQGVRLSTTVVGIAPAFAATVGIPSPGIPSRSLGARRAEIPMQARDLGDGTSGLKPPGGGGVAWVFNNVSGVVRICDTTAVDTDGLTLDNISNCSDMRYLPLSGFVRYSLVDPPDAVAPAGPAEDVDDLRMKVSETDVETCLPPELDASGLFATYFCLMQVGALPDPLVPWSGVGVLDDLPDDTQQCRYGPDSALVVPDDVSNADHPYRYVAVDVPLANQNFLIIPDTAVCPASTWPHP
jgi:Tfp pilus assembly protein PilV